MNNERRPQETPHYQMSDVRFDNATDTTTKSWFCRFCGQTIHASLSKRNGRCGTCERQGIGDDYIDEHGTPNKRIQVDENTYKIVDNT